MKHNIEEIDKKLKNNDIHCCCYSRDEKWTLDSDEVISDLIDEVKWQRVLVWSQSKYNTKLLEEVSILREALEFYKNEDNYKFQPIRDEYDHLIKCSDSCPIYEDNGKIAKKALEAKCE